MAERSSKLILTVITSDTVYMLAVVSHNQSLLWEDKKILDIIKRNIPNITKRFILNNVTNLACEFKEHDIKELRKCGINTINHVGNDFLLGPGLGYTTDGTPLKAVIKKNQDYHILQKMGEYLEKTLPNEIKNNAVFIRNNSNNVLNVKMLFFYGDKSILIIQNSNIYIFMSIIDGKWSYSFSKSI